MKCTYCNDTGKYKLPKDQEKFDRLVDIEMDKAYPVNYEIARNVAYKKVGYTIVLCPYCQGKDEE